MPTNAKVAEIYIQLKADLAEYRKTLSEANVITKQWSSTMREETQKSREAVKLLNEDLGIHLPRGLQKIVAALPGITTAMNLAFDAVVVVSLIKVVAEVAEKVVEFAKKNEEAAKKSRESWAEAITPINDTNDKLELTKAKLENAIAKLEHKPQNKLKEAIAEAKVAADELGRSLDADIKKISESLKSQQHNAFSQSVLHQTGANAAAEISSDVADKFNAIAAGTYKGTGDETKDRDAVIKEALDAAYTKLGPAQKLADQVAANFGGKAPKTSSSAEAVRTLTELIAGLKGMQSTSSLTQDVSADQTIKAKLEGAKENAEEAKKIDDDRLKHDEESLNKLKAVAAQWSQTWSASDDKAYWEGKKSAYSAGSEGYIKLEEKVLADTLAISKQFEAARKSSIGMNDPAPGWGGAGFDINRGDLQLAEANKRAAIEQAQTNEQYIIAADRLAVLTGGISKHQAAVDEARAHTDLYNAKLKALKDELAELQAQDALGDATGVHDKETQARIVGAQGQMDALGSQHKIQQMNDQYAVMTTSWKGMVDSVFDEIIAKSKDTVDQVRQIASHFIDGMNNELAKGMTGQKMDFKSVFQGTAQSMAKASLEKLEGSVFGKLGTQTNPMYTKSADGVPGIPGSSGVGGDLGGLGKSLFGVFFGGHAFGGPALAGVPIPVGELGPETFIPSTPGTIIPHSQSTGAGAYYDFSGANFAGTDPVQTEARFRRAMAEVHGSAVQTAIATKQEQKLRQPRSKW